MYLLKTQLQRLAAARFIDEDGEQQHIQLLPGLSETEISAFASQLPSGQLPDEVRELLLFARGFENSPVSEEIRFDVLGNWGSESLFPNAIELAGDGSGDYWILDINAAGQWGAIFYYCHELPVVIRQSDDLSDFLDYVHNSGQLNRAPSNAEDKAIEIVWKNRKNQHELLLAEAARESADIVLREFALSLPADYFIADLRKGSLVKGFVCKQFFKKSTSYKHPNEPIWAYTPPKPTWWRKLLSHLG